MQVHNNRIAKTLHAYIKDDDPGGVRWPPSTYGTYSWLGTINPSSLNPRKNSDCHNTQMSTM